MNTQNQTLYEFGPFRLDASARLLYRGERVVPLTPKVFETLLVLVEHKGQVLTKETLLQAVWPDSFVEESSLSQNIFLLRRMLKEDGDDRTFIETIPRRGYRFVAEVTPAIGAETIFQQRSETRIVIEDEFGAEPLQIAEEDATAAQLTANPTPATKTQYALNPAALRALIKRRQAGAWLLVAAFILCIPTLIVGSKALSWNARPKLQSETAFQTFDLKRLTDSGNVEKLAISSDGKYVAYVAEENGQQSIWLRQRVSGNAIQLSPAIESQFFGLTFSPDGNYLYYTLQTTPAGQGTLYRLATLGGPAVKVLENVSSPVAFAPDGTQFAFVRGETGKAESFLLTARTDGSEAHVIAKRARPTFFARQGPSWSPDGKRIACAAGSIAQGKAKMGVLTVQVADSALQEFAPPNWSWVGQVAWLPDGSGLALVSWDEETPQLIDQLWLLSYPNGQTRRITTDLEGYGGISLAGDASTLVALRADRHTGLWLVPRGAEGLARQIANGFSDPAGGEFLAMTPDGKIIYSSSVGGHPDLWRMDQDGTHKKQLTDDPAEEGHPVLTADGRYIYFGSKRAGVPHIWRVEVDGANLTQITNGAGELSPSLTPDGRWLLYTNVAENFSLWKVAVAGGAPVRLTDKAAWNPMLSPDGKWIACYLKTIPDAPMQLTLLSVSGGDPIKVFDAPSLGNYPPLKWTPDGRSITYVKTHAGVSNIWGQALEGGTPKPLTNFAADQIFRFSWSPDGKRLLCERGSVQHDIVALSNYSSTIASK